METSPFHRRPFVWLKIEQDNCSAANAGSFASGQAASVVTYCDSELAIP